MIYVHLIMASVFLPLMLLMPLTGSLYLWGWTGDQTKEEVFRVQAVPPEEKEAQEAFFQDIFRKQGLDFDFESIRASKTDFVFRPSTRVHFVAARVGEELVFSRLTPNLLKRLIELHKGHGPVKMRWFESAFGVFLILVTLSGLWLSLTVPAYRKATLISFAGGALFIVICLF